MLARKTKKGMDGDGGLLLTLRSKSDIRTYCTVMAKTMGPRLRYIARMDRGSQGTQPVEITFLTTPVLNPIHITDTVTFLWSNI